MNTTPARRCRVLRLVLMATIALCAWSANAERVLVWAKGVTAGGKVAVGVELTASAREDAQKQVDGWSALDLPQLFSKGKGKFATTPRLYYSVLAGETLNDLKVRSSTLATGESLELAFPKFSTSGFYRVKATVSAEAVYSEL